MDWKLLFRSMGKALQLLFCVSLLMGATIALLHFCGWVVYIVVVVLATFFGFTWVHYKTDR